MKKEKVMGHKIASVQEGSIAWELEIAPGDLLLAVNDKEIEDIFDYHYLMNEEYVELLVQKPDGEQWLLEVEKEFEEELGIEFENSLMDEYRSCRNKCVFCFIDQMPKGMRDTLYFKDDDSRLSFLQGNYITLTNMDDHDIDRIIRYHMEPINISIHSTDPDLRCQMLHNRFAGDILDKMRRLYEGHITMNGQIVLCKGLNDREHLEKSLSDLYQFLPYLQSLSVVPVGLTRFRDGLYPLESFTKEEAAQTLRIIHKWQKKAMEEYDSHFVHAGDEWYLLAEEELPEEERYDGYLQLENGVGMLRLLSKEVRTALLGYEGDDRRISASVATGLLAAPFLEEYNRWIQEKFPQVQVQVIPIVNHFFGEKITVSGLLTGQDLYEQLKGKNLGEKLLLPCNMLRSGENVFLDDMTVEELEEKLNTKIVVTDQKGCDYLEAVLENSVIEKHRRRQIYEQTDCSNCRKA